MIDFKARLSKTLIWGLATLFAYYFFYHFISVNYYESAGTFLTILGSITITSCIVAFLVFFFSLFDRADGKGSPIGYIIIIVVLISVFGNGFMLIRHRTDLKDKELEKNGVVVMGRVADGSSFSGRSFDFSSIIVAFTDSTEKERKIKVEVSSHSFKDFYLDQDVHVIYSTNNMSINKVISSADYYKYLMRK